MNNKLREIDERSEKNVSVRQVDVLMDRFLKEKIDVHRWERAKAG